LPHMQQGSPGMPCKIQKALILQPRCISLDCRRNGYSKEWIFEGPFDTIPLDVGSGENTNPSAISPELAQENSTFIAFLLSQNVNATAAAA